MVYAYDATTMLLRAIEEVAVVDEDTLYIDRGKLREALTGLRASSGSSHAMSSATAEPDACRYRTTEIPA